MSLRPARWRAPGSATARCPARIARGGSRCLARRRAGRAAETLAGAAGGALVLLAPDLSTQAQRAALALADLLRAAVDTATSEPAAAGLLAAQRRGRAAATLGEIRNRADVLLFWGVDPGAALSPLPLALRARPGGHPRAGRPGRDGR